MNTFAHEICPDLPEDYFVEATNFKDKWYKIVSSRKVLYVPFLDYLKSNISEVNSSVEAIQAFRYWNPKDNKCSWKILDIMNINNEQKANSILNQIELKTPTVVACNIITNHSRWNNNNILNLGIALDENTCYTFGRKLFESESMIERLNQFFQNPNIKFIWHNGKFCCTRLKHIKNIDARIDEDTMLLHYAAISVKQGTHELNEMAKLYLQSPDWKDELDRMRISYCTKNHISFNDFTYNVIPDTILTPYLAKECISIYRLYHAFQNFLNESNSFIYKKLVDAANMFKNIELNGMYIDIGYLSALEKELNTEYHKKLSILDSYLEQYWNPKKYMKTTKTNSMTDIFNMNSPQQLTWLLEEILQIPLADTTTDTLNDLILRDISNTSKELLEAIIKIRKINKYLDTYITGIKSLIGTDFRLRGTFNLHGTETGRLSSTNPNLQNIPRDKIIKNLFAASPGKKLIQLDYSQNELRVLALLTQDPWLIGVYERDEDLHDSVAKEIFGENFTKEQRTIAKSINFGTVFGRGANSISLEINKPVEECKKFINDWFKPMPKVKEWIQERRVMALKGEPCITCFGRTRSFILTSDNKNHIQNEYINTPVQSIASDFMLFALLEISDYIRDNEWEDQVKIISTIHDSVILEVDDDPNLIRNVASICQWLMEDTPNRYYNDCNVPFKVNIETGYKWGEMEEYTFEVYDI